MNDYNDKIRQTIIDTGFEVWSTFLANLERTAEPDHTVVRFPCSSSYLFSTGVNMFWMVDPSCCRVGGTEDELEKLAALIREKIGFIVITHLHGDHCQKELARKLRDSEIRWIVSSRFKPQFMEICGIPEDKIIALPDGKTADMNGIRITAEPGYHAEPGKPEVVSCSYDITLPDGIRLFLPVDIRNYEAEIPHREQPVDYIFGHVFLGREDATGDRFSLLDPFCRFMTKRKSSCLILAHLYEIGREARDLWTHRHAAMVMEQIRNYDPDLKVKAPHYGDVMHLVRDPNLYDDPFESWTEPERQAFLDQFGIAVKRDHEIWMERAIQEKIKVVEWNFNPARLADPVKLREQAEHWREIGDTCLSLHFPLLPLDDSAELREPFETAIRIALENRMDRITIHVPGFPVGETGKRLNDAADHFISYLEPLLNAGIRIGIENLHMKPKYVADGSRPFGFIPEECTALVQLLREKTGSDLWGCHLDIGHAYCNKPYSDRYDTTRWLEMCGPLLNGMHIHQFERPMTKTDCWLTGHGHLTERNTGHPSLLPVFRAWRSGIQVPMIMEIMRGLESEPFRSLARIRRLHLW